MFAGQTRNQLLLEKAKGIRCEIIGNLSLPIMPLGLGRDHIKLVYLLVVCIVNNVLQFFWSW
jgi:hypothetical protein